MKGTAPMPKALPSHDVLRQLFAYEPDTGRLVWRNRPREMFKSKQAFGAWNAKYAGQSAKCIGGGGYLTVRINKVAYFTHRIIWKIQTEREPLALIDHINGDKTDNRWINLREATHSQNNRNSRAKSTNTSGLKGVSRDKVYWRATIYADGKWNYLGNFKTPEAAHEAYCKASAELHGDYGRTS
jgi:hypothetical protein